MRKAAALILVLVVMIIVGIGTTAILSVMMSYLQLRGVNLDTTKAYYLAEGYQQIANWQLRTGDAADHAYQEDGMTIEITKNEAVPGSGSYDVEITTSWAGL